MRKFIKISAVSAVIVALVLNLHSAALSFYGIETNTALASQVWSQSTSTDGTSGNGTGGNGTGGDGSSSSGYWCWVWETCLKELSSATTIYATNYTVTYLSGTLKAGVSNSVAVGMTSGSLGSLTATLNASFEGSFTAHFLSVTEHRNGFEITCADATVEGTCTPRKYTNQIAAHATSYSTSTHFR